jgi:peptidoglycan glycosyltransferase
VTPKGILLRALLSPERAAASFLGLRVAFFALFAVALVALLRGGGGGVPRVRAGRVCFALMALCFVAVFAYQGWWQLAGFANPRFVDFMRKYNRRPDNPVRSMVRGDILDRNGVKLAEDDPADPTRRRYPGGPAFCHVVGYLDPIYGMTGLEAADQPYLEGYSFKSDAEQERFRRNLLDHKSHRGNDVALTLDARLQREAARLMANRHGSVVVLKPDTGDILVMFSAPAFDPQALDAALFAERGDASPLFNRALQGLYPPGSTFKIVVAAAAAEQGFDGTFDCPGEGYTPPVRGAKPIRDHEYLALQRRGETWPGHGRIGLERALAKSSNVFFAQLGVRLGAPALSRMADALGVNREWTIYEGSSGRIASKPGQFPAAARMDAGDSAQLAIGQGTLLVTPLHMALIAAAIAHDGVLPRPRLDLRVAPSAAGQAMSRSAAAHVRALMREVVRRGTGRAADLPGLDVAAKTGTAQNPGGDDHAWFLCMAPAARPAIVVVALVEHGGYGAEAALPVAAGVLRKAQDCGWLSARAGQGEERRDE